MAYDPVVFLSFGALLAKLPPLRLLDLCDTKVDNLEPLKGPRRSRFSPKLVSRRFACPIRVQRAAQNS